MIIKSVELENFKSYLNTEVDFSTGISIIMGDNGAGKSSILESISFALFKEFTSKKMDKLINNEKNQMKVKVEFLANGRTYRVIRKRKRNSTPESMLYVENNGKFTVIEKGDASVSSEIEKIIDLDKNLFLNAVYIRQGEIANLITQNPAEKKEMIGRLLGVDDLENSWKNMKFVIDDYNRQEILLNSKLENFGNTEEKLEKKKEERNQLNLLIRSKELELKEKENKLLKLERVKEFFDKKELEYNKITQNIKHEKEILKKLEQSREKLSIQIKEIKIKEAQIEEIKPAISKIPVLENIKEHVINLRVLESEKNQIERSLQKIELFKNIIAQNKKGHNEFLELELQINELINSRKEFEGSANLKYNFEVTIKNLTNEIKKLEETISDKLKLYGDILGVELQSIDKLESCFEIKKQEYKERIKQNQDQINRFYAEISDLKGRNIEIEKAFGELEDAEDKCPVCESDLDESRKKELLMKYESQIENNKRETLFIEQNLKELNSKKEFLEDKKSEFDKINIDIIKKDSFDVFKKNKDINEIKSKLVEIEVSVNKLSEIDANLNGKIALKDELQEVHKKYLGAENSLDSSENSEDLQKSFNLVEKEIEPLKYEINKLCLEVNIEQNKANEELSKLRNIKETFDKLSGEIKAKEEILDNLKGIEDDIVFHHDALAREDKKQMDIGYETEKHKLANENLKICHREFEDLQKEIGILNGNLNGVLQRIDEFKSEIEEFKIHRKELNRIGRFIGLLDEIRKLYGKDGLQRDLRNKSRPLIENNTLEFFNKFNFEYSDIKIDENYDITLFGPSGENTLDMISGGEIIAIAIALRLGIAKTLVKGNLELMILDEPTVHLDSYRRHELIDVIKKLSIIPQMIIVTHDTGLEEAADNILKIEKENGISTIADLYS